RAGGWTTVLVDLSVPVAPAAGRWVRGDVRSAADAAAAFRLATGLGPVRGLVNAAGVRVYRAFADLDENLLRHHLDVNLIGPALWMSAGAAAMTDGGAIVNITSVMAHGAVPRNSAYCASKTGLLGLSRAAALDLAPRIRVNCLAPGPTDTPMLSAGTAVPPGLLDAIPMHRLGTPDDIAAAVAFLLSPDAAWITAATLPVTGGYGP
ncbi:MAG TPA: SDR family oxidoreductase, partial [Pseudonocardiaceae bacterium]